MSQDNSSPACQQCRFTNFSHAGNDVLDIIALLLSFFVLWVKPETTLFPTGLALYMIPCIFDAAKSFRRSSSNWFHGASLVVLGAIAFMGVMGEIKCIIQNDVSIIIFSESFQAIVRIPPIRTVWFLSAAGIPLAFASRKYILPKRLRNKRRGTPQHA